MTKIKIMPKIMAVLLAAVMMLSVLPTFAADGVSYVIDKDEMGSLTIYKLDSSDDNNPIAGAGYTLYRVAEINQTTDPDTNESVTTFDELYDAVINGTTMPTIYNINSVNSASFTNDVVAALNSVAKVSGTDTYDATDVVKYNEVKSDANGKIVFDNLEAGYVYLAVETTLPSGVSSANNFLVTVPSYVAATVDAAAYWNYDVVVYPKNDIESTKKAYIVDDNGEKVYIDSAEYGKVYTYEIISNIPSDINVYEENGTAYYYESFTITDTAGANIEYVLDSGTNLPNVTITVKNSNDESIEKILDLSADEYALTYDAANNTFEIQLIDDSIIWSNLADGDITTLYDRFQDGDYLVITYDAKIVNNVSGTDDTTNTVDVETTPDKGYNTTTSKTVETYDYRAWKVGEDTDDSSANDYIGLAGAEFALLDKDGNYMALREYTESGETKYEWITYEATATDTSEELWKAATAAANETLTKTFTTNAYGLFVIEGLAAGDYYLVEVTAPTGYVVSTDLINITVGAGSDTKAQTDYEADAGSTSEADVNTLLNGTDGTNYYSVMIINKSSGENGNWTLPTTGDMGIGMFIIIGVVLMVAAILLYAYNRKKSKNNGKA